MAKVDLTPAKLAELKKDAGNYKYAFVTRPATVIAMVDEIAVLRRALRELAWDHYTTDLDQNEIEEICNKLICVAKMQLESEAGQ